jgi:hypothetical protein
MPLPGLRSARGARSADTWSPRIPDSPAAFGESWRGLPAPVVRFALQFASGVRQDFGFSGRVLSKIPINIALTIDPLVWAKLKGYRINAVAVSPDRLARAGQAGPLPKIGCGCPALIDKSVKYLALQVAY